MIKAILFDVFGTLLDMSKVPRDELRAYGDHLRKFQETGVYEELTLPESWKKIPYFPDVDEGLLRLRAGGFDIETFSNGPVETTSAALSDAGIYRHEAIDVRMAKGFKPVKWIYPWACGLIGLAPSECMMVTANKDFGDLDGAMACGMQAQLIRGDSKVQDLIQLAECLGC